MTQQILNNNETGKVIRDKINENFDETYDGLIYSTTNTETLSDTKTLIFSDAQIQYLDPGGADRDVVVPAEAVSDGLRFMIFNTGDNAEKLIIKNDGGDELIRILPGEIGLINCDGTDWKAGKLIKGDGDDIDFSSQYALQLQNIPDLASKGAGYWFDGVDDLVTVADDANHDMDLNDFSAIIQMGENLEVSQRMFTARLPTGAFNGWLFQTSATGTLLFTLDWGATGTSGGSTTVINDGKNYVLAGVANRNGNKYTYINGRLEDTEDISANVATSLSSAGQPLYVGVGRGGTNGPFFGSISRTLLFNLALTAAEVKALSSGAPVPFKYIGASQTEQTSGTLEIGKRYRIKDWITNDDFTNIGGTNEDGNEFTATGTTPTTWTNSSIVVQIGCVLQLEQPGIGHNQWIDTSGNELHGEVSGALPTNLPANHIERYVKKAVTGETTITAPTGYAFVGIAWENTTANQAGNVNFGWSDDGQEIVADVNLAGNSIGSLTLLQRVAVLTPGSMDNVYISSDDWNSVSIDFYITYERLV